LIQDSSSLAEYTLLSSPNIVLYFNMYSILYQCLVFITSANIKPPTDKLENCDSSAGKFECGHPFVFVLNNLFYVRFSQHNNKRLQVLFIGTCFDSNESSSGYDWNHMCSQLFTRILGSQKGLHICFRNVI